MTIGNWDDVAVNDPTLRASVISVLKGLLPSGEDITLAASAARGATAGTNGTAVAIDGSRRRFIVLIEFTAKATDANDTCDVYVDVLIGSTWINAIHFTQALGNGTDAAKEFAILDPANPGTSAINVTSDASSGAVRPAAFGSQMRARWVIVDPTGANASFTFSVIAYAV